MILARGRFITFEGTEGVGKSTQLDNAAKTLERLGIDYIVTREPGGTPMAESIRELLLAPREESVHETTELLLMFAARAQHLHNRILPALSAGKWVLCDRFTDATFAYQGGGRQMGVEDIEVLQTLVQGDLRPDKTILLDLPVEEGILRLTRRGETRDRIEQQDLAFKQRVREAYLERYHHYRSRIALVDASAPIHEVHKAITIEIENMVNSSGHWNGD